MEQEEAMDSLLCETPSLLPTLSLSLPPGPQAPEDPAVAPAAAPVPSTTAQTTVNSLNQGKGNKVRAQEQMMSSWRVVTLFFIFMSGCLCLQTKEESIIPQIKLEPHEVDQFLNLSPKGVI